MITVVSLFFFLQTSICCWQEYVYAMTSFESRLFFTNSHMLLPMFVRITINEFVIHSGIYKNVMLEISFLPVILAPVNVRGTSSVV